MNENNQGIFMEWISLSKEEEKEKKETEEQTKNVLLIKTENEEVKILCQELKAESPSTLFLEWFRKCLDKVAMHLCRLSEVKNNTKISILRQQVKHMIAIAKGKTFPEQIQNQLSFVWNQIEQISHGGQIEVSRLYDLRFASQFVLQEKKQNDKIILAKLTFRQKRIASLVSADESSDNEKKKSRRITFNSLFERFSRTKKKNRNQLHQAILDTFRNSCTFIHQ